MSEAFSKLFEPVGIGQVTLKNRVAMAPMETIGMINPDGSLTKRAIDYYVERAKGGVGLIISGLFKVENDIDPLTYGQPLVSSAVLPSVPDFKEDLRRLNNWYKTQLRKLGVEIKLETEVTPELVERENPDEVFVATGSNSIKPDVPGIERSNVVTAMDLLLGREKAGDSAVVIGGGLIGCETALWLAKQGRKVTIVEMLPE